MFYFGCIVFSVIGAVAFLMIVIAGLNYTTSHGESEKTARARRTIIYAAIGLIISVSASIIANLVLRTG